MILGQKGAAITEPAMVRVGEVVLSEAGGAKPDHKRRLGPDGEEIIFPPAGLLAVRTEVTARPPMGGSSAPRPQRLGTP